MQSAVWWQFREYFKKIFKFIVEVQCSSTLSHTTQFEPRIYFSRAGRQHKRQVSKTRGSWQAGWPFCSQRHSWGIPLGLNDCKLVKIGYKNKYFTYYRYRVLWKNISRVTNLILISTERHLTISRRRGFCFQRR